MGVGEEGDCFCLPLFANQMALRRAQRAEDATATAGRSSRRPGRRTSASTSPDEALGAAQQPPGGKGHSWMHAVRNQAQTHGPKRRQ
jgi:hypothetical protein